MYFSGFFYGKSSYHLKWIVWRLYGRLYGKHVKSDTFYGDFMVKLVRRLSGNLIYHAFSIKIPDKLQSLYILWRHNF